MKRKGFSLIELLVVVAIIGILAAVGIVAYSGYTDSAKVNATKSNHANAVKKVALTITDCNLKGTVELMSKPNNKTKKTVKCYGNFFNFSKFLINDMENNSRWKNPYTGNTGQPGLWVGGCNANTGNSSVGTVFIGVGKNNAATICTCYTTPCKLVTNRLEETISLN